MINDVIVNFITILNTQSVRSFSNGNKTILEKYFNFVIRSSAPNSCIMNLSQSLRPENYDPFSRFLSSSKDQGASNKNLMICELSPSDCEPGYCFRNCACRPESQCQKEDLILFSVLGALIVVCILIVMVWVFIVKKRTQREFDILSEENASQSPRTLGIQTNSQPKPVIVNEIKEQSNSTGVADTTQGDLNTTNCNNITNVGENNYVEKEIRAENGTGFENIQQKSEN